MTTTENKYGLEDLVVSAIEQKPTDFEAAFDDLITDRIRSAVEAKKIEVAQRMYNYEPPEVESENEDEFGASESELEDSGEDDGEVA